MQLDRRGFIESLSFLFTLSNLGIDPIIRYDIILNEVPEAKQHIDFINHCRAKYANIFNVPLEVLAYHFHLESEYNPKVISPRLAVGIAQFMRDTAKNFGLRIYDKKKYADLSLLEDEVDSNYTVLRDLERGKEGFVQLFYQNRFPEAEKLKEKYDELKVKNTGLVGKFRKQFSDYARDDNFDRRTNPHESIEAGVHLLAKSCAEAEKIFGGRREHNIIRGIAVYNYGPQALDDLGLPNVRETIRHIRRIMAFSDRVYSQLN